jgi:hypothetical protein
MGAIEPFARARYGNPLHCSCALENHAVARTLAGKEDKRMARYGKAASKSVGSALRRKKHGTLRSGKGGKGGKVASRKQAIAIGLSEARKKGAKVPRKKSAK